MSRWARRVLIGVAVVVVLVAIALVGVGWYFSEQVIKVTHGPTAYPLKVVAASASEVTLPKTAETTRKGTWGLAWSDGHAVLGDVVRVDENRVVRKLLSTVRGKVRAGLPVAMEGWVYDGDPKVAHGLSFDEVKIPSQVGKLPAWYIPAKAGESVWVIAVHGRNASRGETMRILPELARSGHPVLSMTYRNDVGAPPAPDGKHHLGDTEWQDVSSAVDYARSHGATGVVFYGWSMGGATSMTALRRMDDPAFVRGVILDAPVLDWSSTLDKQGAEKGVPGLVVGLAKFVVEKRIGIDLDDLDQRPFAPDVKVPMLIFGDHADDAVEFSVLSDFAKAAPRGLVKLEETSSGHTNSWNEDPARYEAAVRDFLAELD